MTWMTSDAAKERVKEKEARVAEELQKAKRREETKKSQAKMRQLVRTAEEALERESAASSPAGPAASDSINGFHAAKRIALEAVRVYEEQGVGKTCAMRAKQIASSAERRLKAIEVRSNSGSPAACHARVRPPRPPDARASDENRDPLRSAAAEKATGERSRPPPADSAAPMKAQAPTPASRVVAAVQSLLSWRA
jgi:hypothetical protein